MRVLLIGNGIEMEFRDNLKKENIVNNALKKKIKHEDGKWYESEFPLAIREFAGKLEVGKITSLLNNENNLVAIKSVLESEITNKSIEGIYTEIEKGIKNPNNKETLKEIFLQYLKYYSGKTKISDFEIERKILDKTKNLTTKKENIVGEKLRTYDLIFTTNYTDFLERALSHYDNSPSICYVHGQMGNSTNPPLLSIEKVKEAKSHECRKIHSNIESALKSIKNNKIYKEKLEVDIYGWARETEYDLIQIIVAKCLDFLLFKNGDYPVVTYPIFEPEKGNYTTSYRHESGIKSPWNHYKNLSYSEDLKKEIQINYYYFADRDKADFSLFYEKSSQNKKLKLGLLDYKISDSNDNEYKLIYCLKEGFWNEKVKQVESQWSLWPEQLKNKWRDPKTPHL